MNNNKKSRNTIYIQEGPEDFLKIVDQCGNRRNDGMICYKHVHIWLKNYLASPRYLIGEIADAGGNFESNGIIALGGVHANYPCVGGTNYQCGRLFNSVEDAIKYLKKYFTVIACENNTEWTQTKIGEI